MAQPEESNLCKIPAMRGVPQHLRPYLIREAKNSTGYNSGRMSFYGQARGLLGSQEAVPLHTSGNLRKIYNAVVTAEDEL
jgi:hypothetical protein